MSIRQVVTHKLGKFFCLPGVILGATLLSGSAQGFFPALPPTNNLNRGGSVPPPPNTPPPNAPTSRTLPGPGGMPPGGPTPPGVTPPNSSGQTPLSPPGGATPPTMPFGPPPPPPPPGVPEIDPGSVAGALGILISGALMLLDRRRR